MDWRNLLSGLCAWASDPRDGVALLALVISVVALIFTIYKGRYDQIMGVKPALMFVYGDSFGWELQNIGTGPALNIIGAIKESKDGKWDRPVQVPPLKKDGTLPFPLSVAFSDAHGFGVTYEDMWGRRYTTTCIADLNVIRSGLHLRKWKLGEVAPLRRA